MIELLLGLLFTMIVALISSLIGAIFLRAAWKWVEKEPVSYTTAVEVQMFYQFINALIRFGAIWIVMEKSGSADLAKLAFLLTTPFCFLIQAGVISRRMQISFSRASQISLIMWVIGIVILAVTGVVIFATLAILR